MFISVGLIGSLGCVVWVHHMYITGIDGISSSYFSLSTAIISLPTGVKIFSWVFSLWHTVLSYTSTFRLLLMFVSSFSLGGLSGLLLSNRYLDNIVHCYFVVGYFHVIFSRCYSFYYCWFKQLFSVPVFCR